MIQWRWFSGWTEQELLTHLQSARRLQRNFPDDPTKMTLEAGWGQVRSESVLGRERAGPPEPGGLFKLMAPFMKRGMNKGNAKAMEKQKARLENAS